MVIRRHISIDDDRLSSGLRYALTVVHDLNLAGLDEQITLDLSEVGFVYPSFVIPLISALRRAKFTGHDVTVLHCPTYLKSIGFDKLGVQSADMRKSEFIAFMESYSAKHFIPVVVFPISGSRVDDNGVIFSTIDNILGKQGRIRPNVLSGIKYILGEITDNVLEHSCGTAGFVFAQLYPKKGYVDICIGDDGITLLGSYRKSGLGEFASDAEAMKAANSGVSTKNLANAENRGFGITTTRKMAVAGMGGQYIMMSGNAIYMQDKENGEIASVTDNFRLNGTVVALRVPLERKEFYYLNYVE